MLQLVFKMFRIIIRRERQTIKGSRKSIHILQYSVVNVDITVFASNTIQITKKNPLI